MHFWIDKRSQTCGFSGRHRIPSSLSAGARPRAARSGGSSGGGIWGGGCGSGCSSGGVSRAAQQSKPMVTPVHRFQSIESVSAAAAGTSSRSVPPHLRHHRPGPRHHQQHVYNLASPGSHGHMNGSASRNTANGTNVIEIDSDDPLDVQPVRDRTQHSTTPDTLHGPHIVPPAKVKCSSIWISVTLLTVFIGGAEFYFNNLVVVFAVVLVVALVACCYVVICQSGASWEMLEAVVQENSRGPSVVASTGMIQPHSFTNDTIPEHQQTSQEELMLSTVLGLQSPPTSTDSPGPPPPPPPYHIAILLPQQPPSSVTNTNATPVIDESPPPSYEKAIS